jgi:hypothetical protein
VKFESGLQIKEKAVKYRNVFLDKSCKNIQNIKLKKGGNYRKVGVTQRVFGNT